MVAEREAFEEAMHSALPWKCCRCINVLQEIQTWLRRDTKLRHSMTVGRTKFVISNSGGLKRFDTLGLTFQMQSISIQHELAWCVTLPDTSWSRKRFQIFLAVSDTKLSDNKEAPPTNKFFPMESKTTGVFFFRFLSVGYWFTDEKLECIFVWGWPFCAL
jgi:hypothetical protein